MVTTHARRAYLHLRQKLMGRQLPPGTRIRYGPVGKELGISATPVREAIGQLASEGFVELVPQLGAVVRQLTREEAIELYELREAIEPFAARKAVQRISTEQMQQLCDCLAEMEEIAHNWNAEEPLELQRKLVRRFEAVDLSFHVTLLEATSNRRMIKTIGDSHLLTRIFTSDRHEYDKQVLSATAHDHREIVEAIQQKDENQAAAAMQQHIQSGLKRTLAAHDAGDNARSNDHWWQ
ncbi:MAG: GntR family transcriptional regulator [Blastopirellula sp.]|nr:MAG: GntR family transcriptional regulator [Blastopirellula sp.]